MQWTCRRRRPTPPHPTPLRLFLAPSHSPCQADALVGVCRNTQRGCSETYTFDLERFGPPAGAVA